MAEAPELDLRGMLRRLHLTGMADNFADLAMAAATAHLTYETYLAEVVQCECVLRAQRRIARLLRQSIRKVLKLVFHVTEPFPHKPLDGIDGALGMARELLLRGVADQ